MQTKQEAQRRANNIASSLGSDWRSEQVDKFGDDWHMVLRKTGIILQSLDSGKTFIASHKIGNKFHFEYGRSAKATIGRLRKGLTLVRAEIDTLLGESGDA